MSARERTGASGEVQYVRVHGVELAVSRCGKGTPVVCLHAVGHGSGDYAPFAERVGDGYEIICIDWPGQGRSGMDPVTASAARYAQLLEGVLSQLDISLPIVIGNSIGGAAAIAYAAKHPVRALVLCDSGGLVPVDTTVRLFCGLFAALFAAGARGARWFKRLFSLYYTYLVLPSAAARTQREHIIAAAYELSPVLRDAWRSFGRPEADLRATLLGLSVPVWFAWAKHDHIIPLSRVKPCVAQMKQCELSLFHAGHSAFLECPDEFAQGFVRFVQIHLQGEPAHEYRDCSARTVPVVGGSF